MRKRLGFAALGVLLVAGLGLIGGTAAAGPPWSSATPVVVGHVYVNDNAAGSNTIAAFDRGPTGR